MAKKQYLDNIGLDTLVDKIKSWVLGLGYTDNTGTITEVSTSTPLSGGGTSGAVSLSHDSSGVSAGSYGDSTAQTPAFGGTFKVNYETVNATGHVTGLTSHNVTIPNTTATTSTAGLISASDKSKLDGIASGATANDGTITGITTTSPLSGSGTSGSVALSHENSGATAGSYGDSSAQTPAFGGTFKVNYETVNATGHVTALSSHNVTIPNTEATTSAAGLMSAEDKESLDSVSELADETYDMVMSGEANGWLMDENGNVILSDDNTGITMDWDICRVTYEAGTGLSLDGNFFNHSNQITAGSVGDNDERTLQFSETLVIPCITYDAQGHITDAGNITLTMPDAPSTIGTSTVGSGTIPIYLSSGTPTASSSTVGSTTQPVYLNSGTITAMSGALATTYGGTGNTSGRATYSNVTTTNPTSATTYYLPFTTGISSGSNYSLNGNNGIRYNTLEGTEDAAGYGRLYLGNSTASGTAGNKYGALLIYGNTGNYWLITGNSSYPSGNRTLYLPRSTANGYLVATGAGTGTAVGDSNTPVYISSGGIATACSWDDVTESDIDSIFATASPSGYPDDDDDDGKVAPGPEIVDPDDTDDGNSGNDNPDDDDDGDNNPDGNEDGDDGDEMPAPDPGVVIPDDNDGSDDDNDNDSDDSDSDDTNSNDDSETNDNPDDLIETLPDDSIE